jgi:23S rRNA G2069 N7-methylase RlmK/C1962 C5-methylase RlmI
MRLIHGESDGLPGLIADRYGDTVVLQLTATGPDKWRSAIVGALQRATGCARIYERSDSDVRRLEGLEPGDRLGAGRGAGRRAAHRRKRRAHQGRRRYRPQDGILSGPARQSPADA